MYVCMYVYCVHVCVLQKEIKLHIVHAPTDKQWQVLCVQDDTVDVLKQKLSVDSSIPPEAQHLFFAGMG